MPHVSVVLIILRHLNACLKTQNEMHIYTYIYINTYTFHETSQIVRDDNIYEAIKIHTCGIFIVYGFDYTFSVSSKSC